MRFYIQSGIVRAIVAALVLGTFVTADAATLVFRDGLSGYAGTQDTFLSENSPTSLRDTWHTVEWDSDDPGSTGLANIALIRFDGVFGVGAGQIPPGSEITSAQLEYTVNNEGDNGDLHEVLIDWTETVTFNTFGGDGTPGVQPAERGPLLQSISGATGTQSINVTASLAAWLADPSSNRGWVVLPDDTNGVEFRSSEYTTTSQRPTLTVVINEGAPTTNLVRQPYLQSVSTTSIVIVWRTDTPTDSRVTYGLTPGLQDTTVSSAASEFDHVITISGLTPNTEYFYSVGTSTNILAGGDSTFTFNTAPPIGTVTPFTTWVVGDSGTGGSDQAAVRDAMLAEVGPNLPDLFMHVGDMAYNNGTDGEFTDNFFAPYKDILKRATCWPTIGNHEAGSSDSPTQTGPYYEGYVLPTAAEAGGMPSGTEAYYSFDYANAHFICLDSHDTDRSPGSAMLNWLSTDLAATDQTWLIAFWHHPPYTKGTHDSDDVGDSGGRMRDMREDVLPILEAAGVDLVFSGHSHIYERSFLVDGGYDTPTTAPGHIVDSGDGRVAGDGPYLKSSGLQANDGAVYVVAGHGGRSLGGSANHPLMYFSELEYGSCLFSVDRNVLALRNVRDDGVVSDRFTMVKGANTGDCDANGILDSGDAGAFAECVDGPAASGVSPSCLCADLTNNGIVDLADFAALQQITVP